MHVMMFGVTNFPVPWFSSVIVYDRSYCYTNVALQSFFRPDRVLRPFTDLSLGRFALAKSFRRRLCLGIPLYGHGMLK